MILWLRQISVTMFLTGAFSLITAAPLGIGTATRNGSAAIGHLGEGTGRFSADPSLKNASGVVSDVLIVGSVLSATASAMPSVSGSAAAAASKTAKNPPTPDYVPGSHTTFRTDPKTGRVTHYETRVPQTNPQNPNSWQMEKRFDGTGRGHFNKATQQNVPTSHVHDPSVPGGVRSPRPYELPTDYP